MERSTYYIFLPALLLSNLSQTHLDQITALPMLGTLLLTIAIIAALFYLIKPWTKFTGPEFSSVFQSGLRFNSYVGLAGASALWGEQGLALAAVALMGMIPMVNLLAVPTVAGYARSSRSSLGTIGLEVLKNPLILACLAGFGLSQLPIALPQAIFHFFELLGRAALPLGLLAVGAALRLKSLNAHIKAITLSSLIKLLLSPSLTALLCYQFAVTDPALTVAVLFAALPTAPSAYILARQLGGDHELMAATITAQTLMAALTLPGVLFLLT